MVNQATSLRECICGRLYVLPVCTHFFFELRNIKVCYLPPWNSATSKTNPPLPQEPKNLIFFLLPVQLRLSSISALLKRQKPLMIQDTRQRNCCQLNRRGEKNQQPNRHILDDDWRLCIFLSCLWCSSRLTLARICGLTLWLMQHFGVMCLSACQPPGQKMHNQPHSQSLSQGCGMIVGETVEDICRMYIQLWHVTPSPQHPDTSSPSAFTALTTQCCTL